MACVFLVFTDTQAQTISPSNDAAIAERIKFIQEQFYDEKLYASLWTCGWTIINGGSAAYFYYRGVHARNKAHQVSDMVISAGSALAFIGNLATPMVSMYAPYFLQDLPETTRDEKSAKLAKAEDYLKYGSSLEKFGQSWISQSINIATASVGAYVVGYVYRNTMIKYGKNPKKEAFKTFMECFISGELQILSQPMRLVSSQKIYERKYGTAEVEQVHEVRFFAYPKFEGRGGIIAGALTTF